MERERTFNTAGMKLWSAPIGGMGAEITLRFNTETGWTLSTPAIRIPLTRGQIYDLKKAIEWGTERDLEQGDH